MSCLIYDNDQTKEYQAIEQGLREDFQEFNLSFVRNVFPHSLSNEGFEVYLFDFGGMLPGCEDMVASHYRELIKQIEDHQNSAFLLYSSFSVRWYKDCMMDESKEISNQKNVFYYDFDGRWIDKLKAWLNV